ncbi:MAG: DNA polymerase ligase N-terminal domain-containing protein [Planctomycetota bacterium]|jgi:hypothetical protein
MNTDKQQFVVIEHTTSDGVHWDLMLDRGEVLWTWRLDTTPGKIAEKAVSAERISDHPRRFLAYEGPVQNNTGQVAIVDKGQYRLYQKTEDLFEIDLDGSLLSGLFSLARQSESTVWKFQLLRR